MTTLPDPQILDVTIRDGSYLLNHQVSPKMVSDIVPFLAESGLDFMEVSHGCGIGARMMGIPGLADDEELMEAAKKAAPKIRLSAFIGPQDFSLPLIPALVDFMDLGRVGANVDQVTKADKIVAKLKKYKKKASVQLVRAHARPPDFAAKAAKQAEDIGADLVYLVDTFGSFAPNDVTEYLQAIKEVIKIPFGFHGHNHSGMAMANTLAAWRAGATWLDASLLGVGRGAGNTNLESLVTLLQSHGFKKEIKLDILCQATRLKILPLFEKPPSSGYRDLMFSKEKFDFTPDYILELLAQYLHMPLEKFAKQFRKIMGDSIQATDDHIEAFLKSQGEDVGKLLSLLKGKPPNEPQTTQPN